MTKHILFFALITTIACEPDPLADTPLSEVEPDPEPDTDNDTELQDVDDDAAFVVGTPSIIDEHLVMDVAFPAYCETPEVKLDVDAIFLSNPAIAGARVSVSTDCEASDDLEEIEVRRSIPEALPYNTCVGLMKVDFGPPDEDPIVFEFPELICGTQG